MRKYPFLNRPLPEGLEGLGDLALDLRWTGSQASDRLWEMLDPEAWERTSNPYMILQNVPQARLEEVAGDKEFKEEMLLWLEKRKHALESPGWFQKAHPDSGLKTVAYFSMEFGLSESLPIYSGGLGVLAGDHLKTASDLGVPVVGVGILYQQGYFRQILAADKWQVEAFPYNDPISLPITPVEDPNGGWLRIRLLLPGRKLLLRVWQAQVGRVTLYLLDSNDPLNSPWDRGITSHLYSDGHEWRLIQEIVLGVGGWIMLQKLGIDVEVCHLNEGHAAFVVLARAIGFMRKTGHPFPIALWATRAGNVFTTHTPVAAGFDRFDPALVMQYARHLAEMFGISLEDLLSLGRENPWNPDEPLNMAYLAMRGSGYVNGVSLLHGKVSRQIFNSLYPGWPGSQVPVDHVTNGIHVPSWDSPESHDLWSRACGEEFWLSAMEEPCQTIEEVPDAELWSFRASVRKSLVKYIRRRLVRQTEKLGASIEAIRAARHALDPDALTIGFARRFATYKRPNLILHDQERLTRILLNAERPVQLIVAGKAHPADKGGKMMVQEMARFAERPELYDRVVFLEDYDIVLAQKLATGIDVWLNNPRRPWEASGTSGMKMLVNGGLNFSELDGWWVEAYSPEVGWAIGDGQEHHEPEWDAIEAEQIYRILEEEIVPEFYDRDQEGIPRAWVRRVRASMCQLMPRFSSHRMVREYVEKAYLPAAQAYRRRIADNARLAVELDEWRRNLIESWKGLRFGDVRVTSEEDLRHFEVQAYLGDLKPEFVNVELYADPLEEEPPCPVVMDRQGPLPGTVNGYLYIASVPSSRPAEHYTPRIVPYHPEALIPLEDTHIFWQR